MIISKRKIVYQVWGVLESKLHKLKSKTFILRTVLKMPQRGQSS